MIRVELCEESCLFEIICVLNIITSGVSSSNIYVATPIIHPCFGKS